MGDTIAFTVPGGQVGRYLNVIPGAPVFAAGDLAVFFLTAQGPRLPVTTGLTQGIYRVQRDAASGAMLVMPPISDTAGRVVRGDVRRKPVSLAAFEGSVRAIARPSTRSRSPSKSRDDDASGCDHHCAGAHARIVVPVGVPEARRHAQWPRDRCDLASAADRLFHLRAQRHGRQRRGFARCGRARRGDLVGVRARGWCACHTRA